MINKVLIVEDHETANLALRITLEELGITQPDYVYYCDDALGRIISAIRIDQPYDLLITDLYFEPDHRKQQITTGQALITAARKAQPELKILVFSAETKPAIVEALYSEQEIDGFVRKARNDAKELKSAFDQIGKNQRYFPWWYLQLRKNKNAHEFTDYDAAILSLLAQGVRQKEMPAHLEQNNIQPSGLSSIEKRLKHIRETMDFSNNEQLIAYCKTMGII
jgi:two-component system, NarL family, captular synthesis response regulator RcsB